jgi:hypothetical protein
LGIARVGADGKLKLKQCDNWEWQKREDWLKDAVETDWSWLKKRYFSDISWIKRFKDHNQDRIYSKKDPPYEG